MTLILNKFSKLNLDENCNPDASAIILDTETTGINPLEDDIFQIGMLLITYNSTTGKIATAEEIETWYEVSDELDEEVQIITGMNREKVNKKVASGAGLDNKTLEDIINSVDMIIAHNAAFDLKMIYYSLGITPKCGAACTFTDIHWLKKFGITSRSLEFIAMKNGFYYDAHGAIEDVKALAHILTLHPSLLIELHNKAKSSFAYIGAFDAPISKKDFLKEAKYKWDAERRVWWIVTDENSYSAHLELLHFVYGIDPGQTKCSFERVDSVARFLL